VIRGDAGDDALTGGYGDDTLLGEAGDDEVVGGPGHDSVLAESDSDMVLTGKSLSGAGHDALGAVEEAVLFGGGADQTLDASGFTGHADLRAGDGDDVAGDGDDVLIGGPATDSFDGGRGDDRIESADGRAELLDCDDGTDAAERRRARRAGRVRAAGRSRAGRRRRRLDAADTAAPALTGVKLARRTFRTRSTLRFGLSEAAKVVLRVERCRTSRCGRAARLRGRIARAATAGPNQLRLRARIGGRGLRPRPLPPGRAGRGCRGEPLGAGAGQVPRRRVRRRPARRAIGDTPRRLGLPSTCAARGGSRRRRGPTARARTGSAGSRRVR
jgi:hypothetical protein